MCNAQHHPPGCDCGFGGAFYVRPSKFRRKPLTSPKKPDTEFWFNDIHRDQVTFPTSCYWCRETVYFHRNANGGCVLFDELGPPWKVHPCWEQHKTDWGYVSREICNKFRDISLNIKYTSIAKFQGTKSISGCLCKVGAKVHIKNQDFIFIDFFIRDANYNTYQVVLQKEFLELVKSYSEIKITGYYQKINNQFYLIPKNITASTTDSKMVFIPSRIKTEVSRA